MRKLIAYNFISLNGYFKGVGNDINWHRHAEDETKYSEEMLALDNILLFGRVTYEHMSGFWPTSMASELFPKVAQGMNKAQKMVISRNLNLNIAWQPTELISGDVVEKIKAIKQSPGKDIAILGSGSIINLFTTNGLIDEYQIMIDPVAIGGGTPIFNGLKQSLELQLLQVKAFKSGVVLLIYKR